MASRFRTQDINMSTFLEAPIEGEKVSVLLMDKVTGTGTSTGTSTGTTCIRISDKKVKNLNKLLQDLRQDYSINGVVVKGAGSYIGHIELEEDRVRDALSFLFKHRIITKNDFGNIYYLNDPNSPQDLILKWGISVIVQEKENSSPKA